MTIEGNLEEMLRNIPFHKDFYRIRGRLKYLPPNTKIVRLYRYQSDDEQFILIKVVCNKTLCSFISDWNGTDLNKLDHFIGKSIAQTVALNKEM